MDIIRVIIWEGLSHPAQGGLGYGRGKQLKAVGPVASCPRLGKWKDPKSSQVGSGPNPVINQVCVLGHIS